MRKRNEDIVARVAVLSGRQRALQERRRDLEPLGGQANPCELAGQVAGDGLVVLARRVHGVEPDEAPEAAQERGGAAVDEKVGGGHRAMIAEGRGDGKPGMACNGRLSCLSPCE